MQQFVAPITPDRWIIHLFSARTVAEGGIVRRKVADVKRPVRRNRFLQEVRRRGFRAIENGGHFVVSCNSEQVHIVI